MCVYFKSNEGSVRTSHSDLEPSSLGDVLDPLERLVLLPVEVESADLESRHRHLADAEGHVHSGVAVRGRGATVEVDLKDKLECHNVLVN